MLITEDIKKESELHRKYKKNIFIKKALNVFNLDVAVIKEGLLKKMGEKINQRIEL